MSTDVLSASDLADRYPLPLGCPDTSRRAWYRLLRGWRDNGALTATVHYTRKRENGSDAPVTVYSERKVLRLLLLAGREPNPSFVVHELILAHSAAIAAILATAGIPAPVS